jgi:hypothetical protein
MRRVTEGFFELLGYVFFVIACLAFAVGLIAILGIWPNWTLAITLGVVIAVILIIAIIKCNLLSIRNPHSVLEWALFSTVFFVLTTITLFGLEVVLQPQKASILWTAATLLFQGFMIFLVWLWRREQSKKRDTAK